MTAPILGTVTGILLALAVLAGIYDPEPPSHDPQEATTVVTVDLPNLTSVGH